jgi:hypothetical protein
VLYVCIKNKYCRICEKFAKLKKKHHHINVLKIGKAHQHQWKGFKNSVAMHNLKYTKIIGDGDSSVYKKIKESMPYGPHCFIEKIECRNHIMRNYCNKIREIGKMPRVDFQIRNFLRNNILKFRIAVTSAIKYRKCQNIPLSQKIEYLKTDI